MLSHYYKMLHGTQLHDRRSVYESVVNLGSILNDTHIASLLRPYTIDEVNEANSQQMRPRKLLWLFQERNLLDQMVLGYCLKDTWDDVVGDDIVNAVLDFLKFW